MAETEWESHVARIEPSRVFYRRIAVVAAIAALLALVVALGSAPLARRLFVEPTDANLRHDSLLIHVGRYAWYLVAICSVTAVRSALRAERLRARQRPTL